MRFPLPGLAVALIAALVAVAPIWGAERSVPRVQLRTLDGKPVRVTDWKGRALLVDFWASWCAPCKATFPALNALADEMRARGVDVLAVNVDEHRRDLDTFLATFHPTAQVLVDPRMTAADAFHVKVIPTAFVVDPTGAIRHVHEGYAVADISTFRTELAAVTTPSGAAAYAARKPSGIW